MKKVSIIVPIYNLEKYLSKCIDSLINQTLKDIEIILVDNSSTDNSYKIAEGYSKKYKNIMLLSEKKQGAGNARNCGLKKATGEYIMFYDGDDYADIDTCERLYKFITHKKADIVCYDLKYIYPNSESVMGYNCGEDMPSEEYILGTGSSASKIYRKSFLDSIKFKFPESIWSEDAAIIPSLCLYTDKICYLKGCYYNYYQRQNSITNQCSYTPKIFDTVTSTILLKDEFEKAGQLEKYHSEIEYIYITNFLLNIPLKAYKYPESKQKLRELNVTMRKCFPKWSKNKYFRRMTFKQKLYCRLFYYNCSNIVKLLYNIKHLIVKKEN